MSKKLILSHGLDKKRLSSIPGASFVSRENSTFGLIFLVSFSFLATKIDWWNMFFDFFFFFFFNFRSFQWRSGLPLHKLFRVSFFNLTNSPTSKRRKQFLDRSEFGRWFDWLQIIQDTCLQLRHQSVWVLESRKNITFCEHAYRNRISRRRSSFNMDGAERFEKSQLSTYYVHERVPNVSGVVLWQEHGSGVRRGLFNGT